MHYDDAIEAAKHAARKVQQPMIVHRIGFALFCFAPLYALKLDCLDDEPTLIDSDGTLYRMCRDKTTKVSP